MGLLQQNGPSPCLYRVIPQRCVVDGRVTSEAFEPRRSDDKKLSVADSAKITAEGAYRKYVHDPEKPRPVGVLSIAPCECITRGLGVVPDPPPPEHVVVDFSGLGSSRITKAAVYLRNKAVERNWCFKP